MWQCSHSFPTVILWKIRTSHRNVNCHGKCEELKSRALVSSMWQSQIYAHPKPGFLGQLHKSLIMDRTVLLRQTVRHVFLGSPFAVLFLRDSGVKYAPLQVSFALDKQETFLCSKSTCKYFQQVNPWLFFSVYFFV